MPDEHKFGRRRTESIVSKARRETPNIDERESKKGSTGGKIPMRRDTGQRQGGLLGRINMLGFCKMKDCPCTLT